MAEIGSNYLAAGTGTALVMVPGMEGSKEFWEPQIERLSDSYRTVACSLAVRQPSLSSEVADYAGAVLETLDSLGIEKAVFIGESMGGMVVQEIVTSHPERALGLVLVNTMDRGRRMGFGFNMFTLATLVHQLAFLPFLSDAQRLKILNWVGKHRGFVMDPSPGNENLCHYLMAHGTECGAGGYIDRTIACGRSSYTDRLSNIDVPTLVIRGTEDRLVSPEAIVQFLGRIPGAKLALVEGGGHCCSFTLPDETTAVLRDWLVASGL